MNSWKIETHYQKKDGSLNLYKVSKYEKRGFEKLSHISLYEDKFHDQFKDFLFKPIYNKDGDIVGLSRDPVNRYRLMIFPVILTASIILILILIFGIVISQRMAGPIFRIKNYIKDMQKGIYGKKLPLRKQDDFQELADELEKLSYILNNEKRTEKIETTDKQKQISKAGSFYNKIKDTFKKKE